MKADFVRQVKGLRVGLGLGDSAGDGMASKGRPYRTLLVQGFEVLVGRGAEDNDYLTFQVARPRDTWLHVAGGTAGSHVVIRNQDGVDVPREVLEIAAAAAAWYSKSRAAAKVDVHYCRAADVSKPRGAPAGLVQLAKWKSVKVKPGIPQGEPGDGEAPDG